MIEIFNLWNSTHNATVVLYFREPFLDAQAYSPQNYIVGNPGGSPIQGWNARDNDYKVLDDGPETYRPSFNVYMVANSHTVAEVAKLACYQDLAQMEWRLIPKNMTSFLWDRDLGFWIDVIQGFNIPYVGQQLIKYFPYHRFDMGTDPEYISRLQ